MTDTEQNRPAATPTTDVHALLAERRQIACIWGVEDVQTVRPDLSDDQAWEVLQAADRCRDADTGINWDVLSCQADLLFDPATGRKRE